MTQLALEPTRSKIESRFLDFHRENPEVYRELVRLARALRERGHERIGMKQLFEVLRWQRAMATTDGPRPFRLNNSYTSYYSRLIAQREPDLADAFETRRLGVPSHVV